LDGFNAAFFSEAMGAGRECPSLRRFEQDLFHVRCDADRVAIAVGIDSVTIFVADGVIRFGTGQGHCVVTGTTVNCGAVAGVAVLIFNGSLLLVGPNKLWTDSIATGDAKFVLGIKAKLDAEAVDWRISGGNVYYKLRDHEFLTALFLLLKSAG
jgi:hypothetical protein